MAESKKKRRKAVRGEPRKKNGEWRKKKPRAKKKARKGTKGRIVSSHAVSRKAGLLYFVDGAGNVREVKAKRGGTRGHRVCR